MEKVTVLIVGAGPAGSTCGLLLKQQGVDCLLIDRAVFPRDKICGGGLSPNSYRLLSSLFPTFHYDYNSVRRLKLLIEKESVLDMNLNEEMRIVKRRQFDAQLLEEYKKSGGALAHEALTAIDEGDGQIVVTMQSGRQVACDYLVGADGVNSRVRKYLNPQSDHGTLCMEQYALKSPDDAVIINVSRHYRQGYYYLFPNASYDVQGFGDLVTTPQTFRQVLNDMGCPDLKAKGAYIPNGIDYPLHDRIILIGDAGGFPNRVTYEGLYYAFLTASHAAEAIATGRRFAEVNRQVFKNKKKEDCYARIFYSRFGLSFLSFCCRHFPNFIRRCYNRATTAVSSL